MLLSINEQIGKLHKNKNPSASLTLGTSPEGEAGNVSKASPLGEVAKINH